MNNPTRAHHDTNNYGVSAILEICTASIERGHHYVGDTNTSLLFRPVNNTLFLGPYTHLRHGNMAVLKGRRLIITAYVGDSVVNLV